MSKPLTKTKIKSLNKKLSKNIPEDLELIFILQDIEDPYNVGSLFRTAEAVNAGVLLAGKTPVPPHSDISKTSMGMERRVDWKHVDDIEEAISNLKSNGYEIIGVELTENSIPYDEVHYKKKTALILGNEAIGIYKKNLELCDKIVFIPMLGKGPSLNVNVAGAIVAYEVISKNK